MRATHILAILLYNADKFQNKNWLESGLDYNDSQKFVDIKEVSNSLNYVDCIHQVSTHPQEFIIYHIFMGQARPEK